MKVKFEHSQKEVSRMNTAELRDAFLASDIVVDGRISSVYSHYDRIILIGARPLGEPLALQSDPELRAEYFLERREIGIINVGGPGTVTADGERFRLEKLSCLYVGKGVKELSFASEHAADPATYFCLSAPAHAQYPTRMLTKEEASPVHLGSPASSNERTIYKYIHLDGIRSCQLVMGLTVLKDGSVWNSVPPHTHTRRTEAYFYFDVAAEQRIFHFMGEPQETRHLVMANHQAVVSPPWSMHYGVGTGSYAFIWAMAGENQVFTDMDAVSVPEIL